MATVERTWRTRDRRLVKIADMTDSHLWNTILFLRRCTVRHREQMMANPPVFNGEMAQMYADQEWDHTASSEIDELAAEIYDPQWSWLLEEAAKRPAVMGVLRTVRDEE